ncbi:hypothetical protein JP75_19635 [Devosia riboflavina]|uniref:Lipid/polyisoprenoid-binding YceI-like domain-containing protein n=1 Tax=Devosia riboflavina TaxID=46914 RepID=A0A087LYI3_9HYPH|nr:hypothetical protein [Devosia riboflavina]KFL29686.1 hypothetical protein JP75_19635 [Devosia riboflavina]
MRLKVATLALLLAATPAFAQTLSAEDQAINLNATLGETAEAPTAWLGATPHFVMVGAFGDYSFNVNLPALEGAAAEIVGKREYGHDDAGALRLIDFEVAVNAVMNDIERTVELEFANADFNAHTLPLSFALSPDEEFPEGAKASLEVQFEWEWVEKSTIVNEEGLVDSGTLDLALNEGTAANGLIGGFATLTRDGKTLALSFTVPVTEAEIDD